MKPKTINQFAGVYMGKRKILDERCSQCGGAPTTRDIAAGGMDRIRGMKPVCETCLVGEDLESPKMNEYERLRIQHHTKTGMWEF